MDKQYESKQQLLTAHDEAVLEAGKKILIDSINVGREFAKFMITTSFSALPLYFALLKFLSENEKSQKIGVLDIAPPILFILSSVTYIICFFPKHGEISVDDLQEVEHTRIQIVKRRKLLLLIATTIFVSALLLSSFIFWYRMT